MSSFEETIEQVPTVNSKQRDMNVSEFKYFLHENDQNMGDVYADVLLDEEELTPQRPS